MTTQYAVFGASCIPGDAVKVVYKGLEKPRFADCH